MNYFCLLLNLYLFQESRGEGEYGGRYPKQAHLQQKKCFYAQKIQIENRSLFSGSLSNWGVVVSSVLSTFNLLIVFYLGSAVVSLAPSVAAVVSLFILLSINFLDLKQRNIFCQFLYLLHDQQFVIALQF